MPFLFGVLAKGVLIGVIGAVDGVVYLIGNPSRFRSGFFCLVWAATGALCHFLVKTALSVAGGSAHGGWSELAVRIGVIALTLFVVGQGVEHIFHPHSHAAGSRWRVRELGTWLPAAVLGSIDSGPLGFSKGLAMGGKASTLALVGNAALSSLVLFLIIWGVALGLSKGHQEENDRVASWVAALGRLLHVGIFGFLGLTLAVDLGFFLHGHDMPSACLWASFTVVILALRWFLWKPTLGLISKSSKKAPKKGAKKRSRH